MHRLRDEFECDGLCQKAKTMRKMVHLWFCLLHSSCRTLNNCGY